MWFKADNGNKPRVLGPASEKLLRTIAEHDTGQGVHFKWEKGDFFRLDGTDYRVKRQTFHPFYEEYMGAHPTNGPLTDEESSNVGMYVKVTEAGRKWIELRDEGEISGPKGRSNTAKVKPAAVAAPSVSLFLSGVLDQAESMLRQAARLTDRLYEAGSGHADSWNAATEAHEATLKLVQQLEADITDARKQEAGK